MKAQMYWAAAALCAGSASAQPIALKSLPSLEVAPYLGTWHQVLWIPNRFQRQCASDTSATYRDLGDGSLEVVNRCRTTEGSIESITGIARPAGGARIEQGSLAPAQLEVSFLPPWLRRLGVGWGDYWVVELANDGRYAIVSEPSREYLWVLARQPALTPQDESVIRARLQALAFDLSRVQNHPHTSPR